MTDQDKKIEITITNVEKAQPLKVENPFEDLQNESYQLGYETARREVAQEILDDIVNPMKSSMWMVGQIKESCLLSNLRKKYLGEDEGENI